MKMKMKKKIILFSILFLIFSYFSINFLSKNNKLNFLSFFLTIDQIQLIKKYIFPYRLIADQQYEIDNSKELVSQMELETIYRSLPDVLLKKSEEVNLSNNYVMNKYKLLNGFYAGINKDHAGSGYIDFHEDNIIVLSVRGVLVYGNNFDKSFKLKQIKNNIDEFIDLKHFKKNHKFSLKDLLVHEGTIYVSYTEEIKENCWNTSVIYANFDYQDIVFEKLFSSVECVHSQNNKDNEFEALQSGGRIIIFDKENILLSIGDYRSRFLAQDKKSVNGKIIKISNTKFNYEIISMGHRNPQGLYFDKKKNFILATDHGPDGGDEINLIEVSEISKNEIPNYGWPISSAGEHYGGRDKKENIEKYKKYPLYKSHSKYGFIEPLKSFVPSIGISEIVNIGKDRYVVSSLKYQSLYFFELKNKKINNIEKIEVGERIRDLVFNNEALYLFMESSASIGVIHLKS